MSKKQTVKSSKHHRPWFVKRRGSYLPNGWEAWLCYLGTALYLSIAYVYIVGTTENIAWIVFHMLKEFLIAGIVLTWIAQRKS